MRIKIFTKLMSIALLSVAMLSLNSCSKDKDKPAEEPSLSIGMPDGSAAPSKLEMPTDGGSQKLNIVSNGAWKIKKEGADADWFTVSPQEGSRNGQIIITVAKNTEPTTRELTLVFSVNGKESVKTYSVSQLSVGPSLSITPDSPLEMLAEGGSQKLNIVSNGAWKIKKEGTDTDWITISPLEGNENGEVTLTVVKNTKTTNRAVTLAFSVNGKENVKTYSVSQLGFGPNLVVTPTAPAAVSKDGGDVTYTITSNDDWEYTIASTPTWLTEKGKTATSLTLTAAKNTAAKRTASITFKLTNHPTVTKVVEFSQESGEPVGLVANMLDIEFNLDGTAKDLSPMKHTVTKISYDYPFTVAYNTTYKRNMVTFNPKSNAGHSGVDGGSYYRIDYLNNADFQNKLADGHTFECLVQFDVNYSSDVSAETKFFSTHERGGTGFMIANAAQGTGPNGITFLPNIPATEGGASKWIWTNSKIRPDGNSWYHLVGVWDKAAGKAYIYVNGELKGEADAAGFYRPADGDEVKWIAIGGDAGPGQSQNLFKGSLAIARIYDQPLTAAEAKSLWDKIK